MKNFFSAISEEDLNTYYPDEEKIHLENRLQAMEEEFEHLYHTEPETLYSAPGRTEIGGNHTDHQKGCVLAAAVHLDVLALVKRRDDRVIHLASEGHSPVTVDLDHLEKVEEESGTATALVRGISAILNEHGYQIGGFDAYTTSRVPAGSGLSSSAAFEVLVGTILSHEYNNGTISPVLIAQIGQKAENVYFDKPCGLMDQTACSVGGLVFIDFEKSDPSIRSLRFELEKTDYLLAVINTGGSHSDLTAEYAAIPKEMKEVASFFGKEVLRGISEDDLLKAILELRTRFGDRAVLRSMHFVRENIRAAEEFHALESNDFERFLKIVGESGDSSYNLLQNGFSSVSPKEQGIALGLALAKGFLGENGIARVHGGGFAGTFQCFVRKKDFDAFCSLMESVFGKGSCTALRFRPKGGIRLV